MVIKRSGGLGATGVVGLVYRRDGMWGLEGVGRCWWTGCTGRWGGGSGWEEAGHLPVSVMMGWSHVFDRVLEVGTNFFFH